MVHELYGQNNASSMNYGWQNNEYLEMLGYINYVDSFCHGNYHGCSNMYRTMLYIYTFSGTLWTETGIIYVFMSHHIIVFNGKETKWDFYFQSKETIAIPWRTDTPCVYVTCSVRNVRHDNCMTTMCMVLTMQPSPLITWTRMFSRLCWNIKNKFFNWLG